jgi:hypothetical protein
MGALRLRSTAFEERPGGLEEKGQRKKAKGKCRGIVVWISQNWDARFTIRQELNRAYRPYLTVLISHIFIVGFAA